MLLGWNTVLSGVGVVSKELSIIQGGRSEGIV